jgi:hypothetical protein
MPVETIVQIFSPDGNIITEYQPETPFSFTTYDHSGHPLEKHLAMGTDDGGVVATRTEDQLEGQLIVDEIAPETSRTFVTEVHDTHQPAKQIVVKAFKEETPSPAIQPTAF